LNTSKIQQFLDELYVKYTLHTNVISESTFQFAAFADSINACAVKVVLFSDKRGPALVVYPAKDGLNFEALANVTNRNLNLDSGHQFKNQLHGFSIKNLPPFGRLFQMMMIVDERLQGFDSYLIDISKGDSFIEVDTKGLDTLFTGAIRKQFSQAVTAVGVTPVQKNAGQNNQVGNMSEDTDSREPITKDTVKSKVAKKRELPVMPEVGNQLIALKAESSIDLVDLVHLIETDPVISAKVIAYASSPFFSYQGKLESVQEAVYHVLGVDLSMNISLALAMGEQFQGPLRGPFGAKAVWRHSVYCAVLSQSIASKISNQADMRPGSAYLYGLLHNIGFLVLGHMFKKKFTHFNKTAEAKGEFDLPVLEKELLGISHAKVGSLLMKSWSLPEEYSVIIKNHHNSGYNGDHHVYCHVIYLANALLKTIGVGDAPDATLPLHLLEKYNLSEEELNDMLQIVVQWHENLDHLAQQLVA